MRRALPRPTRSRSTSEARRRRSGALIAAAALLAGGLLAWALPALAGPSTARDRQGGAVALLKHRAGAHPGPVVRLASRWGSPVNVLGPLDADLIPPQVTLSGAGLLAVGSGTTSQDSPGRSQAEIVSTDLAPARSPSSPTSRSPSSPPARTPSSTPSRPLVPAGAQQTLALAFLGTRLVLLNGGSTGPVACCSVASTQAQDGYGLGPAQSLASGLEGASTGLLIPAGGGLLAAVDNQAGITVARLDAVGLAGPSEQLVPSDPTPPILAGAPLGGGGALLAWTAPASGAQTVTGTSSAPGSSTATSGFDQSQNDLIDVSTAAPGGLPSTGALAVRVPAGREIGALALTTHGRGATLAWTESWFSAGAFASAVFWADVGAGGSGQVHQLSGSTRDAVGVSLAGSSHGREVLAWQSCAASAGTCRVQAALRPHGDAWGPVRDLGSVDPEAFPVTAQSRQGQSLVGWISGARVFARAAGPGTTSFRSPARVSDAGGASDLALTFGAGSTAVATWIQGTVRETLLAARFEPGPAPGSGIGGAG